MVAEGVAREAHDVAKSFYDKKAATAAAAAAAHAAAEVQLFHSLYCTTLSSTINGTLITQTA